MLLPERGSAGTTIGAISAWSEAPAAAVAVTRPAGRVSGGAEAAEPDGEGGQPGEDDGDDDPFG